jgi:peptidoglycan/LPS O-acetylase OafA/YrhL
MKYNPRFDGLRCIAIAAVMLYHFVPSVGKQLSAGFYGVNLFFVLSGFLITTILLGQGETFSAKNYLNFLGRRALRIFPIYYLALAIVYFANTPNIQERIVYLLTYTYNIIMPFVNWENDYTVNFWSLSVEEQFYLFFPLIVLALSSRLKLLMFVCGGFIILAFLQVLFNIYGIGGTAHQLFVFNYVSLVTNIAPLSLGAIAAILSNMNKIPELIFSSDVELAIVTVVIYALIFLPFRYQFLIVSIVNTLLVIKAWSRGFSFRMLDRIVLSRYAGYIGRISYGIYVYHYLVRSFVDEYFIKPTLASADLTTWDSFAWFGHHPGVFRLISCSVITLIIAHLSFRYLERPLLKLKDKLFPYAATPVSRSVPDLRTIV